MCSKHSISSLHDPLVTLLKQAYGRAIELDDARIFALVESGNIFLMLGSYRKVRFDDKSLQFSWYIDCPVSLLIYYIQCHVSFFLLFHPFANQYFSCLSYLFVLVKFLYYFQILMSSFYNDFTWWGCYRMIGSIWLCWKYFNFWLEEGRMERSNKNEINNCIEGEWGGSKILLLN